MEVEHDDYTDLSDDDGRLSSPTTAGPTPEMSRNSEAASSNDSAHARSTKQTVREAFKTYYEKPELYHQRWKEQFLAKHGPLKLASKFVKDAG